MDEKPHLDIVDLTESDGEDNAYNPSELLQVKTETQENESMSDDPAIEPCKTFKNVEEPVSSGTVNETVGIVGTSNSETSSSALSTDSADNADTLLSILLSNPEDLELPQKPSGIRHNAVFTLNKQKVSITPKKVGQD